MIHSDYIMRMVSMLASFLARILAHKGSRTFPIALTEIDQAGRTLVGMDRAMMRLFNADQLMGLFGSDQSVAVPKAYVLGVLMSEEAEILDLQEHPEEAAAVRPKALHLLLATFLDNEGPIEDGHEIRIDRCLRACEQGTIPAPVLTLLVRQLEMTGRYARAEDRVHDLLEVDRSSLTFAREFYARLLLRSDAELEAGGLTREEVESGRTELDRC